MKGTPLASEVRLRKRRELGKCNLSDEFRPLPSDHESETNTLGW